MDAKRILKYLRQLAKNNNRQWFQEHRQEYDAARAEWFPLSALPPLAFDHAEIMQDVMRLI